jgi:predicted nucleic acid-binding protein
MQKVVLDTNLLFSSLLCQNERRREVLFSKELQFYCLNYVFVELFKHKEKVMRCTKAAETEVYEFLTAILEHIRFVNPELISLPNREVAYRLCADIDEHDTAFVRWGTLIPTRDSTPWDLSDRGTDGGEICFVIRLLKNCVKFVIRLKSRVAMILKNIMYTFSKSRNSIVTGLFVENRNLP